MRHLKPDHIQISDLYYAHLVSLQHKCTAFSYRAFTSVSVQSDINKGVPVKNMSNSKIFQRCTVFGCKTTNRDKIKLHSIPENLSDEWDKVIRHRKPINWKPKKEPLFVVYISTKTFYLAQHCYLVLHQPSNLLPMLFKSVCIKVLPRAQTRFWRGGGTKNFELFPSSQKNTFAPPPPRINFLPPKSFFFPHPP